MIFYKGSHLFVVPKEISTSDIEFHVYDSQGNILGTNFLGISRNTHYTEQDRLEVEELIQDLTIELEIKMKFAKEYGIEIHNWKKLQKPKKDIIDSMLEKWNIPEKIISKYLTC